MRREKPFWLRKTLDTLTRAEWESLCDGCGKCCVNKLEDEDTGEVFQTNVACTLLDPFSCRCRDYKNRKTIVPECIRLTPKRVLHLDWLPETCGYVRVSRGQDLPDWHHLKTGSTETIHQAGQSVRGKVISEDGIDDFNDYIVDDTW